MFVAYEYAYVVGLEKSEEGFAGLMMLDVSFRALRDVSIFGLHCAVTDFTVL